MNPCDPTRIDIGTSCFFDTIQKDPQMLLMVVILFFAFIGFIIVASLIGDFIFWLVKRKRPLE
jgi:uncharacterized Tic20 family protein